MGKGARCAFTEARVILEGFWVHSSATANADRVYLDYSQEALDRAYDQSYWAANMEAIIGRWTSKGAALRGPEMGYGEHRYGKDPCERIDVFDGDGPIVHVHLHGGAWRRQSKDDCSFMAPTMRALGAPFVVPEFGKLPEYTMPQVFAQITRAIVWTYQTFVIGRKKKGILLSGHSSGAHMAALVASHDFGDAMPTSALRAVVCVSGAYDLEPVMLSARRSYIHLSEREQARMSPISHVSSVFVPMHLYFGSEESPEFKRQSIAYAEALRAQNKLTCCQEIVAANHFEIADQFAQPDTSVSAALAALLDASADKHGGSTS